MMRAKRQHQRERRVIIRDGVSTTKVCAKIQHRFLPQSTRARNHTKVDELVVQRQILDAALMGVLQDLIRSSPMWHIVELHPGNEVEMISTAAHGSSSALSVSPRRRGSRRNSHVVRHHNRLRLMQTLLQECSSVHRLVLREPTEAMIAYLGKTLFAGAVPPPESTPRARRTPTIQYASTDTIALIATVFTEELTTILANGLRQSYSPDRSLSSGPQIIRALDLSQSTWRSPAALVALGEGLHYAMSYLQELSLSHCHLEDGELATLLSCVTGNGEDTVVTSALQSLNLSVNFCQEQGTKQLVRLLESPRTGPVLQALDLSCQDVWDGRCYLENLLVGGLQSPCCGLVSLDLSSNFLKDVHLEWILQALSPLSNGSWKNDSQRTDALSRLERLKLRDNSITDRGMEILAQALPMLNLTHLDLCHNLISHQGRTALEEGMTCNTSLIDLSIDQPSSRLLYYVALNRGGRRYKFHRTNGNIPVSLWAHLLAKCCESTTCLTERMSQAGIVPEDLIFDLLHGPVLFER